MPPECRTSRSRTLSPGTGWCRRRGRRQRWRKSRGCRSPCAKKQENVTLKFFYKNVNVTYFTTLRRCLFTLNIVKKEYVGIINYSFHYIYQNNKNSNNNNSLSHPDRRLVLIVRPANALGVPDVGPVEEGHGGPRGEQKDGVQADHCLGIEPGRKEHLPNNKIIDKLLYDRERKCRQKHYISCYFLLFLPFVILKHHLTHVNIVYDHLIWFPFFLALQNWTFVVPGELFVVLQNQRDEDGGGQADVDGAPAL